ncbi:MAG TPA: alpha/beta hydrolase [Acidimicrobiales bacterium]|nr:alpha/beta hydrolase [Acidimicrobiales bacterium]
MPTLLDAAGGGQIALHELAGDGEPGIVVVHATSFNAAALAPLARRMEGKRVVGLDLRGHGAASRGDAATFEWRSIGDDVLAALDWLEAHLPGPLHGFGHSAGGTALLLAAAARPERFARLYCYEPIALTDAQRAEEKLPGAFAGAARRRARFDSTLDALAYLGKRPPLSGLDPEVLTAYVEGGLREHPGGGVELACAPEFEAAVYRAGYEADVTAELAAVHCPVTVAFGGDSRGIGVAGSSLVASTVANGDLLRLERLGHLGPLDDPGAVAASVITVFETPES